MEHLPLEVIVHIYSFLEIGDILAAQSVCRQWFEASTLLKIENRVLLKLTCINQQIYDIFRRSERFFPNIHLKYLNNSVLIEEELTQFFTIPSISNNLEYLALENFGSLSFKTLLIILNMLVNLKELVCIETSFDLYENHHSIKEKKLTKYSELVAKNISKKLISFSFSSQNSSYITLKIFSHITNLENLNIHLGVFDDGSKFNLYELTKKNEKTLKNLSLKFNKKHKSYLKSLLLLTNLNLNKFSLTFDSDWINIVSFFNIQRFLTSLNLVHCNKLNDLMMSGALRSLPRLENLNLENSRLFSSRTMLEISKLKNLKSLNINNTSNFQNDGILNSLLKEPNENIIEFKCLNVHLHTETYIKISEYLPNLKILHCGSPTLTDEAIQAIIQNCRNLIDLNLIGSEKITDYGLIGINIKTRDITGNCIKELENLNCLNLRRTPITDETLTHGLKFQRLKTVSLPACFPKFHDVPWLKIRKVSLDAFKIFTENCKSITEINLLGCSGSDNLDTLINLLMNNLPLLKRMTIARHCERILTSQEAFLIKNRSDLSRIEMNCSCDICQNIKCLCNKFVTRN